VKAAFPVPPGSHCNMSATQTEMHHIIVEMKAAAREGGQIRAVTSDDVNDYLREITAKDFRTWPPTNLATVALIPPGRCDDRFGWFCDSLRSSREVRNRTRASPGDGQRPTSGRVQRLTRAHRQPAGRSFRPAHGRSRGAAGPATTSQCFDEPGRDPRQCHSARPRLCW
jgi:hypothetical protein